MKIKLNIIKGLGILVLVVAGLYYKRDKTVHFTNAQKYKNTILIY